MEQLVNSTARGLLLLTLLSSFGHAEEWFEEKLYPQWRQILTIDKPIYEEETPYQKLAIFENSLLGRVLVLDDVVQTTSRFEAPYHEMMAHVPLLAHGNVKRVLIIGGGDGGVLREVLRHPKVANITLVEIDSAVIELAKRYFPEHAQGVFDDPRVQVVIQDGSRFVKESQETFDLILCDSTDPEGPGAVLFTEEFYSHCKRLLCPGGIFVNQNGVPSLQPEEMKMTLERRAPHFKDVGFFLTVVPHYMGGFLAFGWATDEPSYRNISTEELQRRMGGLSGSMHYYNPNMHKAAFALPEAMNP